VAETLYRHLEMTYPTEFTYYLAHAKMCFALKHYAQAERLAEQALKYSYGDNRLRTAKLLAQAMSAEKKDAEARAVVQDALMGARLPEDSGIRTHRYIGELKKLALTLTGE
jgi:hypothetical protein